LSKPSREELLWEDERLRNADKDVDENHRRSIERTRRRTPDDAARLVFGGENTKRSRLDSLMEFLLCPAAELTSEQLKFRNQLMTDYRLASLLRVYTRDVWYEQFCFELRQYVVSRWKESSVKNSWAQTRKRHQKEAPEKKI
jgi:hypothetical protein